MSGFVFCTGFGDWCGVILAKSGQRLQS